MMLIFFLSDDFSLNTSSSEDLELSALDEALVVNPLFELILRKK